MHAVGTNRQLTSNWKPLFCAKSLVRSLSLPYGPYLFRVYKAFLDTPWAIALKYVIAVLAISALPAGDTFFLTSRHIRKWYVSTRLSITGIVGL